MNRQQRRKSQKARKAVLALLVAGALAASGDNTAFADAAIEGQSLSVTGGAESTGSQVRFTPPSPGGERIYGRSGNSGGAAFTSDSYQKLEGNIVEGMTYSVEIRSASAVPAGTGANHASVTVTGDLTLTTSGTLTGYGGSSSDPGGNATLTVSGNLNGEITLGGGSGGAGGTSNNGRVGGTASLTAANVTASEVALASGNGGNRGSSTNGGNGGNATVTVSGKSNIAELTITRGNVGAGSGSGIPGQPGAASFTTGTYAVGSGYKLWFGTGSAFNWTTLDFNIESATTGTKFLEVSADTGTGIPFGNLSNFTTSRIKLTGTPGTLAIDNTLILISGGIGTSGTHTPWLTAIDTTGFLIEVKAVESITSLVATVVPTISYDANGGSGTPPAPVAIATTSGAHVAVANTFFTAPAGKVFAGWNTVHDGTGGTAYAAGAAVTNVTTNTTLYAQWEDPPAETTYTITYDPKGGNWDSYGGTNPNPLTYTESTPTFTLKNPNHSDTSLIFEGWTSDDGEEYDGKKIPFKTVTIKQGSKGNKGYTASWRSQSEAPDPPREVKVPGTEIYIEVEGLPWYVKIVPISATTDPELHERFSAGLETLFAATPKDILVLFDISLWYVDDSEEYILEPGEVVKITIRGLDLGDRTGIYVVHEKRETHEMEDVKAHINSDSVMFHSDSFSLYGVVADPLVEPSPAPRQSTTPQTGVPSNIAIATALMAISAVGATLSIFALRRNRRKTR